MNHSPPLFALPPKSEWKILLGLYFSFMLFFYGCYASTNYWTSLVPSRYSFYFSWELTLPFLPQFAWLYLSLNFLMSLSLFIFRSGKELFPFFWVLTGETLFASFCFLFIPFQLSFPSIVEDQHFLFRVMDTINLNYNCFPSLHVAFAWTSALVFAKNCLWKGKVFFYTWALGISLSTVILHQHHVIDVLGGIALAWVGTYFFYFPMRQREAQQNLEIEFLCLKDFYFFIRRHRRYFTIFLFLYLYSLGHWKKTRVLRVTFCFLQHVDDLLDQDRPCFSEPLHLVSSVIHQIQHQSYEHSELGKLTQATIRECLPYTTTEDQPIEEIIRLLEVMQTDRQRVLKRQQLKESELTQQHRNTFYYSVNLLLMLTSSELRAKDAEDLLKAFGWCSTMRDLEDDLRKGLINLPHEVITRAQQEGVFQLDYFSLIASRSVKDWIQKRTLMAEQDLKNFESHWETLKSKTGAPLLKIFLKSMQRLIKRWKIKP